MTSSAAAQDLHPYVREAFRADPLLANEYGLEHTVAGPSGEPDSIYGSADGDGLREAAVSRSRWLSRVEAQPAPPRGTAEWLEREVLLTELRSSVAADRHVRAAERVPYWYTERVGRGLATTVGAAAGDGAAQFICALRELPSYLAAAQANLRGEVPAVWAEMGASSATGLQNFLTASVAPVTESASAAATTDVESAAGAAHAALSEFVDFCRQLQSHDAGRWRGGREYLTALLTDYQHLAMGPDELQEWGEELLARSEQELQAFATHLDPAATWQEQIAALKAHHPEPADLLDAYGAAVEDVKARVRDADLVSFPADERCDMEWVPEYLREGLPLGQMEVVAPYGAGFRSAFQITPSNPVAPEQQRREHLRDNCYAFIASIVGHETYPGHHLQSVHHKAGTSPDSALRYFRSPQFVEGWGLYVEDLLEETGIVSDAGPRLFQRRNAVWRALRVLIDVGLHAGDLSPQQAVRTLVERAGMDEHMATGEVRRYLRHDNPSYPSSYALGRDLFHAIRAGDEARRGAAFSLKSFHDRVQAHGSPPLPLLRTLFEHEPVEPAGAGTQSG